jgi:hypothetical protein
MKTRKVHTVAFLPTAGIFQDSEGVYLLEKNWSALADDFRTFLSSERLPAMPSYAVFEQANF